MNAFCSSLFVQAVNILFPHWCCGCRQIGTLLCDNCFENIDYFSQPIHLPLKEMHLDKVWVLSTYEGIARSLITTLKYQAVIDVGKVLAELLYYTLAMPRADALVPVPLHTKRLQERGFNQSSLIANELGVITHTPVYDLLKRNIYTAPQALVHDRTKRVSRLDNCFAPNPDTTAYLIDTHKLPHCVLLIDDVVTTGTTLNECAKVLKSIGIKEVEGLAIAHGR